MITKKQFEETYRKFPPSKCELFYIKYISISSLSRNVWPAIISSFGLMIPFIITFFGNILYLPKYFSFVITIFYVCILAAVGAYTFVIWHHRRMRIHYICRELNITKQKYENLVKLYYYENYYPDIKDYINTIIE